MQTKQLKSSQPLTEEVIADRIIEGILSGKFKVEKHSVSFACFNIYERRRWLWGWKRTYTFQVWKRLNVYFYPTSLREVKVIEQEEYIDKVYEACRSVDTGNNLNTYYKLEKALS